MVGDENGDFEVTPNGTIITKKELDRERQGLYNLVVVATDQASPPNHRLSSTVQVRKLLTYSKNSQSP